ncbi:uncharacterized protein [Palaemon carinicauda]|uniref:uncharacterized protein n=1 Tax=Palaemon carinicauda TaxID=392227 RepID=UPI0035B5831A
MTQQKHNASMRNGSELWALKQKEDAKLEGTEMRMLMWIIGISLLERMENGETRRVACLVKITEMIRVLHLRWCGHVLRMDGGEGVRRTWEEPVMWRRSKERQRIGWRDKVKDDMERRSLLEDDALIEGIGEGTSGNRPLNVRITVERRCIAARNLLFNI